MRREGPGRGERHGHAEAAPWPAGRAGTGRGRRGRGAPWPGERAGPRTRRAGAGEEEGGVDEEGEGVGTHRARATTARACGGFERRASRAGETSRAGG
jgi:hypothetical protein